MKVCFIIAGFGEGGAQKQCIYLLNELQKYENIKVDLLYFYDGINFTFLNTDNLTVWMLPQRSFYDPRNIFEIIKRLRVIQPDILFSWLQSSDVYASVVSFFLKKTKWVLAERDSSYPSDWRFKLRRFVGRRSDLIIANSKKGVEYWGRVGVTGNRIVEIKNILMAPFVDNERSTENKLQVIFAGRLEAQKNVITVAKAFNKLACSDPNVHCYIIGNGSLSGEVEACLKDASNVSILPFQKNIGQYFSSSKVFVNISFHEGMPNTVIENIALGVRVVVSRIEEHESILGVDYPFYVNRPDDVDEVLSVIQAAVSASDVDSEYEYARSVLAQMDAGKIGRQYFDAFNKLICQQKN